MFKEECYEIFMSIWIDLSIHKQTDKVGTYCRWNQPKAGKTGGNGFLGLTKQFCTGLLTPICLRLDECSFCRGVMNSTWQTEQCTHISCKVTEQSAVPFLRCDGYLEASRKQKQGIINCDRTINRYWDQPVNHSIDQEYNFLIHKSQQGGPSNSTSISQVQRANFYGNYRNYYMAMRPETLPSWLINRQDVLSPGASSSACHRGDAHGCGKQIDLQVNTMSDGWWW
jgi:hypothetical protein